MTAGAERGGVDHTQMLFCSRCDNLLYPTTDHEKRLIWTCRACMNDEVHDTNTVVYSLVTSAKASGEKSQALEQLRLFAQDPTVPVTYDKPCPKCGQSNVAWFVNPLEQPTEDMSLFFACRMPDCRHVWKAAAGRSKQNAGGARRAVAA